MEAHKKRFKKRMRSEIQRRIQEELRRRAKSRQLKERLERAGQLEKEHIEARIKKLEGYSQKLQESRRRQQELEELKQRSMQDNYVQRLANLAERQLRKDELDEQRHQHLKDKDDRYREKITLIKECKSSGSKAEDAKRLNRLRELEAECTIANWSSGRGRAREQESGGAVGER